MPEWLIELLAVGVGLPLLLRLLPNKKLLGWGQWLSFKFEQGRYFLYVLAHKGGALVSKLGRSKLGKKAWEKIEAGTIEAILSGFIRSEDNMPWSGPLALAFGLMDGLNSDEEGYQKKGPGVKKKVIKEGE